VPEIETETWREVAPLLFFVQKALSHQSTGLGCPSPRRRLYQAGMPQYTSILWPL